MHTINTPQGTEIIIYQDVICHNVFTNVDFQIFYTQKGHFVYDRRKNEVTELTWDAWTRMVLKLESLLQPQKHTSWNLKEHS